MENQMKEECVISNLKYVIAYAAMSILFLIVLALIADYKVIKIGYGVLITASTLMIAAVYYFQRDLADLQLDIINTFPMSYMITSVCMTSGIAGIWIKPAPYNSIITLPLVLFYVFAIYRKLRK